MAPDKDPFVMDSSGWIEYFTGGPFSDRFEPYVESSRPDISVTSVIIVYEVYKRMSEAFRVLSRPEARARYDAELTALNPVLSESKSSSIAVTGGGT